MSGPRTGVLGGESGARGLLGGSMSRARKVALVATTVAGAIATLLWALPGAVAWIVMSAAAVLATAGENSVMDRWTERRRRKDAAKRGVDAFRPFDQDAWDQLAAAGKGKNVNAVAHEAAALRAMPDGAEGMGWLSMRPGAAGVAWHAPAGEDEYLSVTFSVSGQLRGIQPEAALDAALTGWGGFQASFGGLTSLVRGVQSITRVLPPESARHEAWVRANLEPLPAVVDVEDEAATMAAREAAARAAAARAGQIAAVRSYDGLLHTLAAGSMVARHYVTCSWPLDAAFKARAAQLAPGRDGWRDLMASEVEMVARRLREAGMGRVEPLTAWQTAAVIRHMQHPDWPIDQAGDADPANFGMPAEPHPGPYVPDPALGRRARRKERRRHAAQPGAHLVRAADPRGAERSWYHSTGVAVASTIAQSERTGLWLLPILTGMRTPIVRTLAITRRIIPAGEALAGARSDLTKDEAEKIAARKSGKLGDEGVGARATAAARRRADLTPGSGHAGVEYLIAVTVSARSEPDLLRAQAAVAEVFETGLGITRIKWLTSYAAAASGLTWPIGRGLAAAKATWGQRFERRMAR